MDTNKSQNQSSEKEELQSSLRGFLESGEGKKKAAGIALEETMARLEADTALNEEYLESLAKIRLMLESLDQFQSAEEKEGQLAKIREELKKLSR